MSIIRGLSPFLHRPIRTTGPLSPLARVVPWPTPSHPEHPSPGSAGPWLSPDPPEHRPPWLRMLSAVPFGYANTPPTGDPPTACPRWRRLSRDPRPFIPFGP